MVDSGHFELVGSMAGLSQDAGVILFGSWLYRCYCRPL
jgi:hypothetical protein